MGGHLNSMYVFVCGNWQKHIVFTFNRSVTNAQFFSAKYMFTMIPKKEHRKNSKKTYAFTH